MWHRYWSPSIMNFGQLVFTWKGRHLLLALFASLVYWNQKSPSNLSQSNKSRICTFLWSFIKRITRGTSSENEWQWVTTNYNEWQRVVQRATTCGTTSDNEWQQVVQRMTMSGATSDNAWQRVTANDKEWYQMIMSDSEWQNVVQWVKTAQYTSRMDDCNFFYNKNRCTTSRDGWLILEWLNK